MKLKASGKVTEFEFGKHYNTVENLYDFEKMDQKGYFGKFSLVCSLFRKLRFKLPTTIYFIFPALDPFDEGGDDDEEEEDEEEGSEDEED
jgi:hypothetical protein